MFKHLFIGSDYLIHIYKLEFISHGEPGVETFTLNSIRVNVPMTPAQFEFSPPINPVLSPGQTSAASH